MSRSLSSSSSPSLCHQIRRSPRLGHCHLGCLRGCEIHADGCRHCHLHRHCSLLFGTRLYPASHHTDFHARSRYCLRSHETNARQCRCRSCGDHYWLSRVSIHSSNEGPGKTHPLEALCRHTCPWHHHCADPPAFTGHHTPNTGCVAR